MCDAAPAVDQMKVTMLLADYAQVAEGKLYVVGGGWSIIGLSSPSAIALYVEVPWEQTNTTLPWALQLLDSDGDPVLAPNVEAGKQEPLVLKGAFEVGRPPGIPKGTRIGVPLAMNLGALPMKPSSRYEWRFTIGDQHQDDWRLPFSSGPE